MENKRSGLPLSLRVPHELLARLNHVSAMNGRQRSEEVRAALELHILESMSAYLDTDAGAAELGDQLEETRAHIRREVARWRWINYIGPRGAGHSLARSYCPS